MLRAMQLAYDLLMVEKLSLIVIIEDGRPCQFFIRNINRDRANFLIEPDLSYLDLTDLGD